MVIVWENEAKRELRKAYGYILQHSFQNAVKVRQAIIDAVLSLPANPERYSPDKFKIDNDGSWRAFELYRYRISYRVKKNEIRIVRLRHTSRSPQSY